MINGEGIHYISVRIVESQILSQYLSYLHPSIYSCTLIRSYFISKSEAKLLNDININHSDHIYGKEQFHDDKDFIVRIEDIQEFYAFIDVCYKKLLCKPVFNDKCGFICINSESIVPYCTKDYQKYIPLFYFEGEIDNLIHYSVEIKNWNLAYLKFCCTVQGIRNELYASDLCIAISLDDIKVYFPPETNFEDYWPSNVIDLKLINQNPAEVNPPCVWISPKQTVMEILPAQGNVSIYSFPTSAPVRPLRMILPKYNTNHNGCPVNQMVC